MRRRFLFNRGRSGAKRLLLLLFLFPAIFSAAEGASSPIDLLYPPENSLYEWELASLVLRLKPEAADKVSFSVNQGKAMDISAPAGREFLCKTVKLDMGPNEVTITASKNGAEVGVKKITLFYRSDISREFRVFPPEFNKSSFHRAGREEVCKGCHSLRASGAEKKPARPEESPCFSCHEAITAYSDVHGPAARWDCLACHSSQSEPEKYATPKPDRELCFVCHSDKKEEWGQKKYTHGPTSSGKCTLCHNPHASPHTAWLRKSVRDLCLSCHEDRGTGKHVTAGFQAASHPTKGKQDPLRPGKEMSCVSCHNPHAANSRWLFAHDARTPFSLCAACHKK